LKLKMNFNFKSKRAEAAMLSLHPRALLALVLSLTGCAVAGNPDSSSSSVKPLPPVAAVTVGESSEPAPIQDNSFLIEEAYNQEDGVIQHISYFQKLTTGDWAFAQTDEWPLRSLKHQLSVTVAATHAGDLPASGAGWGDTFINYRYQLTGTGETRVAIAPRLSLLLPSGNQVEGRDIGGTGLQTNLLLSLVINRYIVTHWNVGATWVPRAENERQEKACAVSANLGQSVVWLIKPRFNALVETLWTSNAEVTGPGRTTQRHDLYISPSIRWAYNFKSGLQIVPGVGLPLGVGPSGGEMGMIFYLSFEHPYRLAHSR
jgi:hypothetical protein